MDNNNTVKDGDSIYFGQTRQSLLDQKELLRNFYYGKDLNMKSVRKFYKRILKLSKKELKRALKETK